MFLLSIMLQVIKQIIYIFIIVSCFKCSYIGCGTNENVAPIPISTTACVPVVNISCIIKQDLSDIEIENNGSILIETNHLRSLIMDGQPSDQSPPENKPFLTIINIKDHQIMYFPLTSYVSSISLKETNNGAKSIIKKEKPLQVELWIDASKNISVFFNFIR